MDISPAISTPAKGDPITAAWAAQVAAAVNSSATALNGDESVQTPFGTAEPPRVPPALGAQKYPQPFDAVIYNDSGTEKVAMFLPSGSPSYVWLGSTPLSAAAGQNTGNANTAWVDVESVQNSARYIYLAVHADANGDPDGWKLYPTGTADSPPSWAVEGAPMVLLAVYDTSAAHFAPSGKAGLNQYRHGAINLSDPACCECPDVYSVTKQTGTLPSCVSARYVFKRQHREIDPETGECVDSTGTGSSETTNIDVPEPPEYALSSAGATGCKVTISLTKTPCGGNATSAGSVTLDKARTYAITEDLHPPSCVDRKYSLDETCDGSTSSVGTIVVPSPPEYSLDSSSVSGGTQVDLKVKPCGGTASVVSSVTIPSATGISGTFLTGLTSLAVTSAGLTLTANTATYVDGVLTATGTTSATVEKTTC